jgi:tRNA A-37 threonylcarbamoyl transferase component Bud32
MKTKITFFGDNERNISRKNLYALIETQESSLKTLKDDRRSLVFVVEANGVHYVVKNPRDKNRRLWIRFLTLFRSSEAMQALDSMKTLLDIGLPTTKPVACIEKVSFGMVVEGWAVYEYLDAKPIATNDIARSFELLDTLHSAGFLHGNPQEQNFLHTGITVAVIDAKLVKTRSNSTDTWIEKIKFANSFIKPNDREVAKTFIDTTSLGYHQAFSKMRHIRLLKRPKYWLRGLLQDQQDK